METRICPEESPAEEVYSLPLRAPFDHAVSEPQLQLIAATSDYKPPDADGDGDGDGARARESA